MDVHPQRDNPDAPLGLGTGTRNKNEILTYSNIRVMLKRLGKKAGIKKRLNPYIFRKSRVTHLANYLTEAQMNQYFGWVQGSNMPSIYVHMSGRDVDNTLLKLHGLKKEEPSEKEKLLKPKECPRCKNFNSPTGKFCTRCGIAMDIKTAIELDERRKNIDELMSILVRDPEVQKILIDKITKLRLEKKLLEL
ncbi:MAG: hypothetical protein ACE5K4_11395 [Candidatus Hydrothermarchaeota archaeon]